MENQRTHERAVEGAEGRMEDRSAPEVPATRALSPQVVAIMTTEHATLQTGRAMTIADANGRASLFLGTVSTSLVALAFVGGLSRASTGLGQAFSVFALVLLPSLVFLGLVT